MNFFTTTYMYYKIDSCIKFATDMTYQSVYCKPEASHPTK